MIVIIIIAIIILLIMLYFYINNKFVVNKFKDNNTITFGVKGSGKDLLTQLVIYKRQSDYMATIDYGYKYQNIGLKQLSVYPNTSHQLIEQIITKIKKIDSYEGIDSYISDGGIYLPSHEDNNLSRLYPSFPIYYALSRHLYNSNIHINTQAIGRIWIKVREQADHYFMTRGVVGIGKYLFIKVRYFSEYSSAEQHKLPMAKDTSIQNLGLGNKFNKALKNQFNAENGIIRDFVCVINKKHIKYDTRVFHKTIFGITFTDWKNALKP